MSRSQNISLAEIKPDEEGRYILDNPEKIIFRINYQFEKQEQKEKESNYGLPPFRYIDLSNCVISTVVKDGCSVMTNLCEVAGKLDCIKNTYQDKSSKFHQEVLLPIICRDSILYAPYFHQTKFHGGVNLDGTQIRGNGGFSNCEFCDSFFGQDANFGACNFSFSEFHDAVYLNRAKFRTHQLDISRCIFHESLHFTNITLDAMCLFNESMFHGSVILNGTNSSSFISFEDAVFEKQLIISHQEENSKYSIKKLSLRKASISDRVDIEGYHIESLYAHFTEIKQSGIFRIYCCKIDELYMQSISDKGFILLEDNKNDIKSIILQSAINPGNIEIEETFIPDVVDRKTARLLKDSALKSNNAIDAVRYKRLEAKAFQKENNIQCHEKILLWLNGCSNKHGTSWVRALWITLIAAFLFSSLILYFGNDNLTMTYCADDIDYNLFFKTYFGLLDVVNFKDGLKSLHLNVLGFFFLFFSKIIIAYLYYQFISAFRKYGK